MFREGQAPPNEELNIFLNQGGLGDVIAALPAVVHSGTQNADVILWTPFYFTEFARTVLPKHIKVMDFKDIEKRNKYASAVQMLNGTVSPMRTHLIDHSCSTLIDKILDPHEKNYLKFPAEKQDLTGFNLPEKFVILTPGFTADVREWLPKTINEVAEFVKSKGYEVVFLGNDKALTVAKYSDGKTVEYKGSFDKSVNYDIGYNLVNKTSLNEAAAIMSKARAVVGLDNGLLHLAGCTDVAIVGGFTTVDPKYRMPYRNDVLGWNYFPVVPPESLGCRFCQSNWSFVYEHDFKKCWYKETGKDIVIQCTKQLDSSKYIAELEKIL